MPGCLDGSFRFLIPGGRRGFPAVKQRQLPGAGDPFRMTAKLPEQCQL
jgi:hypothetical protein